MSFYPLPGLSSTISTAFSKHWTGSSSLAESVRETTTPKGPKFMQSPPPGNLVLQGELSSKSFFPVTAPIVPILQAHSLRCLGLEALASSCNLVPADHRLLNQTNPSGRFCTAVFHGTKVPSTLNSGGRERPRGTGCSNAPALNGACVCPAVGREAEKSHQCLIPQLRARL